MTPRRPDPLSELLGIDLLEEGPGRAGHGQKAMAVAATIHFTRPAEVGDVLTAEAREISLGTRTGTYAIEVTSGGALVALFTGTVHRRDR